MFPNISDLSRFDGALRVLRAETRLTVYRPLQVIPLQRETGHHYPTELNTRRRSNFSIFSRSCCWILMRVFFSETRKNFLSNELGLVSLYALWKKLSGVQTRDFGPIFGKSPKTRKSPILDRFGPPIGSFFAKSVLPHIFPSDS